MIQNIAAKIIRLLNDKIGVATDAYPSTSIFAKLRSLLSHIHSSCSVYPTLANPIAVTGGVAAWALGNFAELIPANAITSSFDIHWINFEGASANDSYELILYAGALASEVEIGRIRTYKVTGSATSPQHFQCAVQPANTRISAKLASQTGGSDSVNISVQYHVY